MRVTARAVGFWLDCCWNGLGVRGVAEAGLDTGRGILYNGISCRSICVVSV